MQINWIVFLKGIQKTKMHHNEIMHLFTVLFQFVGKNNFDTKDDLSTMESMMGFSGFGMYNVKVLFRNWYFSGYLLKSRQGVH